MYRLRPDPRAPAAHQHPTWRSLVGSVATLALVPLGLWVVSQPLAAAIVLAAVTGLLLGVRRVNRLVRCFQVCQGLTWDLGGLARITVTQIPSEDAN